MTVSASPRRARRTLIAAMAVIGLLTGAAACAQGEPEPEPSSSAPVLGADNDRVQLMEGASASVEGSAKTGPVELRLTGYRDGSEPTVVISARPENGEAREHTLTLGEHLEAAGASWRVSEIGISASEAQPASVTLTREAE
ncbi:DUF6406 domain-containing protein [Streptomonospora wellingtoniae]|uniref:DUF6406 domain-containing protein n=1 Tax=Streptomonospora wellingtoniae TaxID=3075544 RepID=A0ABU2KZH7_9ACTN|nr:DUF6406 domain-containing protein [Streptomonospora sp. DSM 45055]MDT0304720.1 DUF6406 domain-containing protein [Streptomonospora sp. DSM 45055]